MNDAKKAFECQMCGHCCHGEGGIVLAHKDRRRLAKHMGLSVAELLDRYTEPRKDKALIITGEDGYCIFFRQGKGCSVHPGRPDICRAWPFFKGNLVDEDSWAMVQDYCPGINADAGHEEFRRQGLEYIKSLEVDEDDDAAAEALTDL